MKSIFKYVLTYIFVVLVLFGALVLTSKIPKEKSKIILKNIHKPSYMLCALKNISPITTIQSSFVI